MPYLIPSNRSRDLGLLLLRLGIGAMIVSIGWPKITGGAETWERRYSIDAFLSRSGNLAPVATTHGP